MVEKSKNNPIKIDKMIMEEVGIFTEDGFLAKAKLEYMEILVPKSNSLFEEFETEVNSSFSNSIKMKFLRSFIKRIKENLAQFELFRNAIL